jgi:hypothetical protein
MIGLSVSLGTTSIYEWTLCSIYGIHKELEGGNIGERGESVDPALFKKFKT